MSDPLSEARAVANPFVLNRVDSAWDDAPDVESINAAAFAQCLNTIDTVRATHQSRGLLLTGDPGSGKSHLLHRVRRQVLSSRQGCFVYVPPVSIAGSFFTVLLGRVVADISRQPHEGGATQLDLMVASGLPGSATGMTPLQRWTSICRSCPPGPDRFAALEQPFEQLVMEAHIDPEVALVLRHYVAGHRRYEAYCWLRASPVPDDVLTRLGVRQTLDEDGAARRALIAISLLAGANSALVLAFDQLEGMQLRKDDLDGVRTFGNAVADLLIHCRNIAAISCVQDYFYSYLGEALEISLMDRIAQDSGALRLLRQPEAMDLVEERLLAEPTLARVRADLRKPTLWPLDVEVFSRALGLDGGGSGVTARTVLCVARQVFQGWQQGPEPEPDDLATLFQKRQDAIGSEAPDENTMADGLLKLLDLTHPGQVRRSSLRGVQIEVRKPEGIAAVAVCHALDMRSLSPRLQHLGAALGKDVMRLTLVRDARLPISQTASVTQERLRSLQDRGGRVLRPLAGTNSALAAARQLLDEAMAGDLCLNGRTVSTDEVRQWLLSEMPQPIRELLNEIEVGPDEPPDDVLDKLRATLDGVWVRTLDDACGTAGLNSEAAMKSLLSGQNMVGLVTGEPSVIFLRPDGISQVY